MNERIQELYAQAIQYADSVVPANNRYNDIYYAIASGKHAELIVRECMDVVDPGQNQVIARYQARQWLAEHFGVES